MYMYIHIYIHIYIAAVEKGNTFNGKVVIMSHKEFVSPLWKECET